MTAQIDLSAVRDAEQLTIRAATLDDLDDVFELIDTCERHHLGAGLTGREDLQAYWQRPGFDLATDSAAVLASGRLVAYGEVYKGRRADAYVHPSERGRGLGTALARWTWQVCRARGGALVGQTVPAPSDAAELFAALGYVPRWTSWILEVPPGAALVASALPPRTVVRDFRPGQDEQETFDVIENAFSEWPDRDPSTLEDWLAISVGRPGFESWQLQLAVEESADDVAEVVGAAHVTVSGDDGWVPALAVRRDRRGLGLGRALLVHAFDQAQRRGALTCGLSTDSRTGALGVYEHVGMRVKQTFAHYARKL